MKRTYGEQYGLSKFNTSKVTDMGDMFWCCTSLAEIRLSGFSTTNNSGLGNGSSNSPSGGISGGGSSSGGSSGSSGSTSGNNTSSNTKPMEVKVGTELTDEKSGAVYIVTKLSYNVKEVTYCGVGDKQTTEVKIPIYVYVGEEYYLVTAIGDEAFKNCTDLKEVKEKGNRKYCKD